MTLKEEMQYNAGILNEGLQFFKTSNKLYKFALKMQKKVDKNPQLMPLLKEIEKIAKDFEKLESQYKNKKADKEKVKESYENLKKRYNKILDLVNKKQYKDLIGKFTLGGIMTLMLLFIGAAFNNYADVAGDAENVLADINQNIDSAKQQADQLKLDNVGASVADKLKRTPEMIRLETELEALMNQKEATRDALEAPRKTLGAQVSGALGITAISGLVRKLFTNKNEEKTFNKLRTTIRRLEKE